MTSESLRQQYENLFDALMDRMPEHEPTNEDKYRAFGGFLSIVTESVATRGWVGQHPVAMQDLVEYTYGLFTAEQLNRIWLGQSMLYSTPGASAFCWLYHDHLETEGTSAKRPA